MLLAGLLAGCSGDAPADGPSGSDALPSHGAHNAGTHLLAPNWTLGDYWTWSSPQIEEPYTSVLVAESATDWTMGTDNQEIAFFDARFDIASLGAVRKSDLAGSQGSTRVQFFQFPMMAGNTWSTTWDELPLTMEVVDVQGGIAKIEAKRADGTFYAKYTYDDNKGYFGQIDYYNDDGTEIGFSSRITGSGKGFSGDLVRWTYTTALEMGGPIAGTAFGQNLPVPLTITDVYAELFVDCTAGAFVAGVAPMPVVTAIAGLEDRGTGTTDGACPLQMAFSDSVGEPRATVPGSTEEQWGFSGFADATAQGTYRFNIFLRTLETYQIASA